MEFLKQDFHIKNLVLYINDLPKLSKKLTFYFFADDTNIHFASSDLLHLQKTINKELRIVSSTDRASSQQLQIWFSEQFFASKCAA